MLDKGKAQASKLDAGRLAGITRILVDQAHPKKIILFGSYARGDFHSQSDVDLLVIQPEVDDPFDSAARLRLALREVPMSVDIIVVSEADVAARAHLRGTMLYHALREGSRLYVAT
jgi:predicted nucleotidyltransferase